MVAAEDRESISFVVELCGTIRKCQPSEREMDADELARIQSTLSATLADAKNRAATVGMDEEFRKIVKHARVMRKMLEQGIRESSDLITAELDDFCAAADHQIAVLRQLAALPSTRSRPR